jgi:hypothetical protein
LNNKIIDDLLEIYSMIPDIKCQHCNKCCNHIIWFEPENILINKFLKNNFLKSYSINYDSIDNQNKCPFLEKNRCSIYPVRPIVCRLQGNVKDLSCYLNMNHKFMNIKKLNNIRNRFIHLLLITNGLDFFYSSRKIKLGCLYKK